ncbi:peptide chain release factor 1 [Candidatus Pacearchaeota archaeon]|nr:peptide chain release factor 1 [Candidatus Pacearchaeota archaeon]|tara:strand:+ start:13198 stop:14313 length:1116 start_codon:yes stop_codon:yes gene_type:complete
MVEITDEQKAELEELVETLSAIRGRHTELVTVLIPAGQNINLVSKQLEGEKSTANNIKSKHTRNAVISAIEMIIRKIKEYQKTPENGIALFAGNVSDKEGVSDVQIWAYEPPKPLNVRTYRCDQVFVLDPLKEILEVSEVFGLLAIDRQEATIGVLEGKQIKVIRKLTSGVPGKTRAGGQSSQRFERITEGLAKEFFRRVAEAMKEIFFEMPKLKGILIGGPIPTKEDFLDEGQLATKLKEKVISIKDIGYVDEHGLELLVEASEEDIAQQELIKEKKILERFFETLGKKSSHASYGIEKVAFALQRGAVETLLLTKKFLKTEIDKTKEFEESAKNIGSEVVIISDEENQDAQQFQNLTKGVGAILRFQIE